MIYANDFTSRASPVVTKNRLHVKTISPKLSNINTFVATIIEMNVKTISPKLIYTRASRAHTSPVVTKKFIDVNLKEVIIMIVKAICEVMIGLLKGIRRACLVLIVDLRRLKNRK